MKYLLKELNFWGLCKYSHHLWQHDTQAKSSKQAKTTIYQIPVCSPTWLELFEDNKQTFSANEPCSGCRRYLSKLVVSCYNEKVGKSGKEINNINNIFNHKGKVRFKYIFPFYFM